MSNITLVLESVGRGESNATDELFPLVYEELRRMSSSEFIGIFPSADINKWMDKKTDLDLLRQAE